MSSNPLKRVLVVLLLVGVSFFAGYRYGGEQLPGLSAVTQLKNTENAIDDVVDFNPFWVSWNILNDRYVSADVSTSSPQKKEIYTQDLVWGAIQGLAASLGDPYTTFLPPKESEIFKTDISGNFQGVGMEIDVRDNILTVVAPLKGTPADKAGVKAGDFIIEIDGVSTLDIKVEEAVDLIRGPQGTTVVLTIIREGESDSLEIPIVRDVITIPSLDTETIEVEGKKIFVIHLFNFSAPSAELFRSALREFVDSKTDKLIIDLRSNPGGFLDASIDMASWFLPEGKSVVREYYGEGRNEEVHRSRGYNIFTDELKLVVLVDRGSASASEILAGALSEHGIATVVGEQTFGKGSVQELIDITDKTSLKVTVARWLTPNGVSISAGGLTPDVVVDLEGLELAPGDDPFMDAAIATLLDM